LRRDQLSGGAWSAAAIARSSGGDIGAAIGTNGGGVCVNADQL